LAEAYLFRVWQKCGVFIAIASLLSSIASSEEAGSENVPIINATIVRRGLALESVANVGLLSVGKNNQLRIKLHNPLPETIRLGKISASCGCVRVTCDRTEIEAGKSCELEVQLRPERQYRGRVWTQSITFEPQEGSAEARIHHSLTVTLRANLAGVFQLSANRILFDVPSQETDVGKLTTTISILTTPPVAIEKLKLAGTGVFELLDIKLTPESGETSSGVLAVSINAEDVPTDGLHCGIVLTDPATNQRRVIAVSSISRPPLRIVPSTVTMRRNEADDGWEGFVLAIRGKGSVDIDAEDGGGKESHLVGRGQDVSGSAGSRRFGRELTIRAVVGDCELQAVAMGGGPFARRVKLSLSDRSVDGVDGVGSKCSWDLIWGRDRVGVSTEVVFLDGN
jgi:hypothetical protein